MRGYFNKPLETAATFTEDGWLKTGDAGAIDEEGNLFITERLKDLMKTSGGKYIAPQMLEGTLAQDRFIEQVAIIADARKFVSALIVPCFESLEEYAKSVNLKYRGSPGTAAQRRNPRDVRKAPARDAKGAGALRTGEEVHAAAGGLFDGAGGVDANAEAAP